MFGFRDEFPYLHCGTCGSLGIVQVPEDLGKYYAKGYYAHGKPVIRPRSRLRHRIAQARNRLALSQNLVGRTLNAVPALRPASQWLMRCGVSVESTILDVGCGDGRLLVAMRHMGFRNLVGVEPFLQTGSAEGGSLLRGTLEDVSGTFDLIMFHHSFEHIADGLATLRAVEGRLAPGGRCLIRMPVVPSYAWEAYGADWVQLDAPRHLMVYSREGLRTLAERAGLRISRVVHDSTTFQFVRSELYLRDIPLMRGRDDTEAEAGRRFSKTEMRRFRRLARKLNRTQQGDQVECHLVRIG